MDSCNSTLCCTKDDCDALFNFDYDDEVQAKLDSPMPWIGMYIAAASAACSLAMETDTFNGFRPKKLWFPCKYLSLNAFSLAVLAVTMKLPVDLTNNMRGVNDKLARISSLLLMSIVMGNFVTSLGMMENNEMILNMAALCILVATIAGNVCIRVVQMRAYVKVQSTFDEEIWSVVSMLLLLVILCCMAMMILSAKIYMESKYNEMHKKFLNKKIEWGNCTSSELRNVVKMYWLMAATGSPEFVMARSAVSCASGLICVMMALTLVNAHIGFPLTYDDKPGQISSSYKWSIKWILYIQSIGVVLGTTAPLLRWFLATRFKISEMGRKSLRDEFKIEKHWTSKLVEWRESPTPFQI